MTSKFSLRKKILEERKALDIKAISELLLLKLVELDEYKKAQHVMLYYPLKHEINLLELLKDESKNFYIPKIDNKTLKCCPYSLGDELSTSYFNTKEPISDFVDKSCLDLVIIPALAVDVNNYRLGYGGGFYDRFLLNLNAYKIVCIPQKFILDTVYPEIHDICIDKVITA